MTIDNLEPKRVWKNFYSLTQIPRPSKREEKAVAFLYKFGKSLGLETKKDELGNIIIRKPATKGMEGRKGIILQAHIDMVPQKNNDVVHDWDKDPIKTRIVGDWVYATGTTLGADDGMGVATAMAILEAKDLQHGPIEALFTIDEETGMTGAKGLKGGLLKGDILINLDSEDEGELYVGCAGGLDATAELSYKAEPIPPKMEQYEIVVKGLRGGHSGMEINEGRANANKMMARVLLPMLRNLGVRLISLEGGNLRNAIPREAFAKVAIPIDKVSKAKNLLKKTFALAKVEYSEIDANLNIFMEKCASEKKVVPAEVALRVIKCVYACPCGVDRMSLTVPGLVETSNNLAIVNVGKGKACIKTLMRGSIDSAKLDLSESIRSCFELAGMNVKMTGGYSGWMPNMKSPILKEMKEVYKKLFKKEASVKAIHAGLECGILATNYPNWDMISCGATLRSPHSPDERVLIESVDKFWKFIVEVIKNAPMK